MARQASVVRPVAWMRVRAGVQHAVFGPAQDGLRRRDAKDRVDADPYAEVAGDGCQVPAVGQGRAGDLVGGEAGQAQGHQPVVRAAVLAEEALQIAGPLVVPGPEVRSHGGVDSADASVDERVERRVGVRRGTGVVGEVEHRRDARIQRGERREAGADVHVVGCVDRSDAGQGRHDVGAEIGDVGDATA
jgi:hypothetical protein